MLRVRNLVRLLGRCVLVVTEGAGNPRVRMAVILKGFAIRRLPCLPCLPVWRRMVIAEV